MKSRPFISTLALLLTAIALHAADQLKFTYVSDHFEATPGGQPLGACHGGAVIDKAGNIYVTTDTDRGIVVFNSAGKFLRAAGPSKIHALEIRDENGTEYIYAARPSAHEVIKLTLTGENVWTLTYPKESNLFKDANGFNPCAVTVSPDGSIFVADGYGSNYVLKFDKNRNSSRNTAGLPLRAIICNVLTPRRKSIADKNSSRSSN